MFCNLVAGKRVSESDDGTLRYKKTVPLRDQSVHVCSINQRREHTSDHADIISTANCNVQRYRKGMRKTGSTLGSDKHPYFYTKITKIIYFQRVTLRRNIFKNCIRGFLIAR